MTIYDTPNPDDEHWIYEDDLIEEQDDETHIVRGEE